MLSLIAPGPTSTTADARPADELLDALGLTSALPEALIQDAAGHTFEPVQLSADRELAEQFAMLIRPEPVGGAEQLIYENRQRIATLAIQRLRRAIATAGTAPRTLVGDTLLAGRELAERLEAARVQADETYGHVQERLHTWQGRLREPGRRLGGTLWRWLVGGDEALSLPEAVALWNRREYLALQRSALQAACTIVAQATDLLGETLAQLDARLAEVRSARASLQREYEQLHRPAAVYGPWTLLLHGQAACAALAARADAGELVADLLGRLAAPGSASLADAVRELARAAAERTLAPLGLVELLELEAGDDPLVPVGQALLDSVQQPTWQLKRGARPRIETIQLTPDGSPLYSLEGLGSAAYGAGQLCLGFVQVQLGVARDDLALIRDDDEAFAAALRQRNLFALDDLAQAWPAHAGTDPQTNGHAQAPDAHVDVAP